MHPTSPGRSQGFPHGRQPGCRQHDPDGLWDIYNSYHMGDDRRECRREIRYYAGRTGCVCPRFHRKSSAAWKDGRFTAQIVPVEIPARKTGEAPTLFRRDESVREDATLEALRKLDRLRKRIGTWDGRKALAERRTGAVMVMSASHSFLPGFAPPCVHIRPRPAAASSPSG